MIDAHENTSVLDLIHKGLFKKKTASREALYKSLHIFGCSSMPMLLLTLYGARKPEAKEKFLGWTVNA